MSFGLIVPIAIELAVWYLGIEEGKCRVTQTFD
jgi:hypothetical protein